MDIICQEKGRSQQRLPSGDVDQHWEDSNTRHSRSNATTLFASTPPLGNGRKCLISWRLMSPLQGLSCFFFKAMQYRNIIEFGISTARTEKSSGQNCPISQTLNGKECSLYSLLLSTLLRSFSEWWTLLSHPRKIGANLLYLLVNFVLMNRTN